VALRQLLGLIPKTLSLVDLSDGAQGLAPGQEEAIACLICRQIAGLLYPQLLEGARR
jgi:hypothetical protein